MLPLIHESSTNPGRNIGVTGGVALPPTAAERGRRTSRAGGEAAIPAAAVTWRLRRGRPLAGSGVCAADWLPVFRVSGRCGRVAPGARSAPRGAGVPRR